MMRLRTIRHMLLRFAQVGGRHRALVIESVVCLLLARLALIFIPFPRLARRLGSFVPPNDARALKARVSTSYDQAKTANDVGWAVTRAARYVPFKAVCLPQAMAARIVLERRGISSAMHFGARMKKKERLESHAWLDAAGVEVTGYPGCGKFRRDRVFRVAFVSVSDEGCQALQSPCVSG